MEDFLDTDESFSSSSSSPSPLPQPSPHKVTKQLQTKSLLRRSRIKKSSRRFFLDRSSDDEQQTCSTWPTASTHPSRKNERSTENDNSWMCPLATEDDTQGESSRTFPEKSGVVLKLRRTHNRKTMSYRPVLDSEISHAESRAPDTELDQEFNQEDVSRWPRTAFSKRKLRSLTRKYCPYLSTCHSADYRRRWVLRSARNATKVCCPDLVGKRIQHLYEEDDKSEVWYRGEVLGVHKANPNPLKTVFEVRYDSEPEWRYYLELLIDYKKGWLKIDE